MSDTPTLNDIILEGLQMSMEANAASMIMLNARVAQIGIHLGIDLTEPKLSEVEERNKNDMLKSVGTRLQKIMQMSAAMQNLPEPTPEQMADAIQAAKDEIWPDGSVSGTQPDSNACRVNDTIAAKHDGTVVQSTVPNGIDDETTTALMEAVENAEPIDPAELFAGSIFEDAEPVFPDDSTVDVATAAYNEKMLQAQVATAAYNEKMRQAQAAEEPLFKSYRKQIEDGFTVTVATVEDFGDIDIRDPQARAARWKEVVEFYCNSAQAAVEQNWMTQPYADRLKQEFCLSPQNPEITSSLSLPDPGDVSNGVAQAAASGDTEITVTGLSAESEIIEALFTAFMVTAARYNMVISAGLLDDRLSQLGMSAD